MKTYTLFKSTLAAAAVATLTWLGTMPAAEARPGHCSTPASRVHVSGHCHCGLPLYTERYFAGYDCHGQPRWGYRQVRSHTHQVIRPQHRHPIRPQPYPYYRQPVPYRPDCGRTGVTIHGAIR